jgi:hypothetical protein
MDTKHSSFNLQTRSLDELFTSTPVRFLAQ